MPQSHPKTTSAPANVPPSVSKTKKETKVNNQLTILKEQVKEPFDNNGDFLTGRHFTQGDVLDTFILFYLVSGLLTTTFEEQ